MDKKFLFIEKAKLIHDNKYDYSHVEYKNNLTKVKILCTKHGFFEQTPKNHLRGGCKKCGGTLAAEKTSNNTENFINKAKELYGSYYDYSKTNYINNRTKVIIICNIHGEFSQIPKTHLKGSGCNKCSKIRAAEKRALTGKESFIERAKSVHNDKYDYTKSQYIRGNKNIIITCKIHGDFLQRPTNHLLGNGCIKCCGKYNYSSEEWIRKAILKHGDEYDYSKTKYKNAKDKVIITCKKHGDFLQKPTNHIRGNGCIKCYGNFEYTTNIWIEKAIEKHGYKYDYSKVNYVNLRSPVVIICRLHGEFLQQAYVHLYGSGCSDCAKKPVYNTEKWIKKAEKIHLQKYEYTRTEYIKSSIKIIITCKIHGDFKQTPNKHLLGKGCSKCSKNYKYTNEEFINKAKEIHKDNYDYTDTNYINSKTNIIVNCKFHGKFNIIPCYHLLGYGCQKCYMCPSCQLFKTNKNLCSYCKPFTENKLYQKTKEMKVVKFLRDNLPDQEFIHNKSVSKDCTNSHLFPDIRFDCIFYNLIIEVDEFKHRGAQYSCDEKRMYDIIAKLGQPCIFIRYNPDSKQSNLEILLEKVKEYLDCDENTKVWDEYGFLVEYLFY